MRIYIGVGSNISPETHIALALDEITAAAPIISISTFYKSPPADAPGTPDFINGVCCIDTAMDVRSLKFDVLRNIEKELGRVRSEDRNAPRPIDLDILIAGDVVCDDADLSVPDPEVLRRPFLYRPLLELDPGMIWPGDGSPISAKIEGLEEGDLDPLPDFTASLRNRLRI